MRRPAKLAIIGEALTFIGVSALVIGAALFTVALEQGDWPASSVGSLAVAFVGIALIVVGAALSRAGRAELRPRSLEPHKVPERVAAHSDAG
ncbi:hypothetical protein ASE14_13355 [Agromyces sp. Root81]|uniref:hypothetical protein n=1 Tax=Agromyces sp. Root81 TaxID=1736601 RepID=UPI0006F53D47|nr:hypothetical protein [Agromyces sp. Root81]KRC61795.1 hypothetical protein ASE14_13355 [Agromyces sp. Root81]